MYLANPTQYYIMTLNPKGGLTKHVKEVNHLSDLAIQFSKYFLATLPTTSIYPQEL